MVQSQALGLKARHALAIGLVAGAVHALALAWPSGGQALGWLQMLALAGLAAAWLRIRDWRQGAVLGWAFSCAMGVGSTWWLYISMHQYGGLAAPLAALAVLALQAALGLYLASTLAVATCLRATQAKPWAQIASFAGAWLLAELARAQWFTGFPWGAAGYAHIDSALAMLAPHVGVYGMGLVSALLAIGLALAWGVRGGLMRSGAMVMSLAVLLAMTQAWRAEDATHEVASVALTLLQGNVPQDQKYEAQRLSAPLWYLSQIEQAGPGLILAPETAFALPTDLWPEFWRSRLRPHTTDQAVMVGAPWRERGQSRYSNSVLAWAGGGQDDPAQAGPHAAHGNDYRYDKHHLVPFGEFIPWGFAWFVNAMRIPLGEFERGASPQATWHWGGLRWAPNICYEDLFGEELARSFGAGHDPHVLVNFSNIAWFGDTIAQAQHLNISRLRTLELQRPMVRVTNTGATAVIDHRGVVQASAPAWQRTALQAQVHGREGQPTFYARWAGRWGLWPLWALGLLLLLWPAPSPSKIRPAMH